MDETGSAPGSAREVWRRAARDRTRRFSKLAAAAGAAIGRWSAAEAGRLALWAPVAIGSGAAFYFSLRVEPPGFSGVLLLAAAVLAARAFSGDWRRAVAAGIALAALGFLAADLRAALVAAPPFERALTPREVTGRLVSVEESAASRRFVIAVDSIARLPPGATPARVRVSWRGREFEALPGERIRLRAGLNPPPPPAAPGAFDFARHLYFQRIGAVGYAVTAPERLDAEETPFAGRLRARVETARLALARRIVAAAPGEGGAIVAAVATGKREAIPEAAERALQRSGLAHLLAISGLHMGLATGLVFFAVRLALAAVEPAALRHPIKKWAAAAALAAGVGYLILSGGGWSARRAFIMTSIVFLAILADRRALSLRNVAIAASVILLTTPEAVMHPGFQMSFAAATALIAAYEWASRRADPSRSFAFDARARRYVVGIAATDAIAATATAPFALYHFNYAAIYSLPANLAAMPLMAFWIMPFALTALALAPLGLDGWAWRAAAQGVDWILAVARAVSSQPGAVAFTPQWPPAALGALTLGGLWLCLQSAPWRLAGLAAIPLAGVMIALSPPPDLFVAGSGENLAVRVKDDTDGPMLAAFDPRKDRFALDLWKEAAGLDPEAAPTGRLREVGRCGPEGCVAVLRGARLAVSTDPLGLAEDCARADLVVALYFLDGANGRACAARLVDRGAVWREGAHAVWIGRDGAIRIRTVAEMRGKRPWTGAGG
ncbi:ComEC/Rec2 family competence protein [Amphiplicatus metriothermophilus]|uniref:Competence protein ComEC n=1 Tax=Amphiplicatus metriothermophilus TaxID=1519374 RepID=A0A239Q0U9_9PROT|nr:ComEC/Rec2 family competence protein [Amphiplicatus metriothermophilus]MBB5520049.1 competence protein ComEC [Amphiplicatus metriothermophilus]SNT75822.1 competence protein ComEC [Amphiplicatus metriothermophilus]